MNKLIGFLTTCTISVIYGVVVTIFMFWLLFPADFVRQWIPQYIESIVPRWHVTVGELELDFPGEIILSQLKAVDREQEQGIFSLTRAGIRPEILSLIQLQPNLSFAGEAHEGIFNGTIARSSKRGIWQVKGRVEKIEAESFEFFSSYLNRQLRGTLALDYSAEVSVAGKSLLQGNGAFLISDGTIGLQRQIAGHGTIPFSLINGLLEWQEGRVVIQQGLIESDLFTARFSGNIEPAELVENYQLSVTGTLQPTDKFFATDSDKTALLSVRNQLDGEGIPFYVSGRVASPAISFGEYSTLLNSLLAE